MAQPYTQVLTYVNGVCNDYIGANVSAVASAIAPAAYSFLGVYVILWGLASMRGLIQEPFTDMAVRMVKIAFIFGVGIQLAEYNVYVTDIFFNGPEQLAAVFTHTTTSTSVISSLDTVLQQGFQIGQKFWQKGGLVTGDVGMYLIAIIVWAVTIITTLYACALIVLAKIALSLIISVGPLFIISLLFQATANFFNSWVQQLANYFMLMVLVIAGNVFVLTLFQRAASSTSGITSTAQIDQIFPFLITGGLSLYVLAQIPNMASGLAGGVSLSTYGMGRLGLSVFGRGAKAASGRAARGIGKGTRKAARAARTAYQGRKRNSVSPS